MTATFLFLSGVGFQEILLIGLFVLVFFGAKKIPEFMKGLGSTVIIKHGEYLTVYAGLKEVFVRSGQKVITNQEIGKVFSNNEGVSELRFQIFKNTTALDPQGWLKSM